MFGSRSFLTLAFVLALAAPVMMAQEPAASSSQQTSSPQTSSTSSQKKKKVWTEDDLRKLKGGVNVVGETAAASPKKDDGKASEKAEAGSGILADREGEEAPAAEPEKPACKSWSWAAAVETVLAAQGVGFGQIFWLSKSYGGEVCTQELGSISSLARRVEGDYTLDDGTKVRIEARTFPNFPDGAEIVASEEKGLPYVVDWKGHPYVTAGYKGVKLIDSNTGLVVRYSLDSVDLVDPYEGRQVTFDRAKDSLSDIQGLVQFVVVPR